MNNGICKSGKFAPLKTCNLIWLQCIDKRGDFVLIQPKTVVMSAASSGFSEPFDPSSEALLEGEEYMISLWGECRVARALTTEGLEAISFESAS